MDTMLRDRLESINERLIDKKKQMNRESLRQRYKMSQLGNNVEQAYNAWSNSSLNQDEALKAYQSLFPGGKCIELGTIPLKGNKSTTAFSSYSNNNGNVGAKPNHRNNESTMSNTIDTHSRYKYPKLGVSQNKANSNRKLRGQNDSIENINLNRKHEKSEVTMSKSEYTLKNNIDG